MNTIEHNFTGALLDPRTEEAQSLDWKHEDIAAAAPAIEWAEKPSYRYFDKRNQAYSSSCMMQSGEKMLGVENFVEEGMFLTFSARCYRDRAGYPNGGMFHQDCLSLLCKPKSPLESQLPSQGMSEAQMNEDYPPFTEEMTATAQKYKAGGYFFFTNPRDMDAIASIIDQGKAVQVMLYFKGEEYWKPIPEILYPDLKNDKSASRHGVAIVDRTLFKGKKAFIIEDSAGNSSSIDKKGQRIITEDFFIKRCFSAAYLLPLANIQFQRVLKVGMKGTDVGILQKILKDKGYFPSTQSITNYFGTITFNAVQAFQKAKGLHVDGIVGANTQKALQ